MMFRRIVFKWVKLRVRFEKLDFSLLSLAVGTYKRDGEALLL
jgi:hypothetical protein